MRRKGARSRSVRSRIDLSREKISPSLGSFRLGLGTGRQLRFGLVCGSSPRRTATPSSSARLWLYFLPAGVARSGLLSLQPVDDGFLTIRMLHDVVLLLSYHSTEAVAVFDSADAVEPDRQSCADPQSGSRASPAEGLLGVACIEMGAQRYGRNQLVRTRSAIKSREKESSKKS